MSLISRSSRFTSCWMISISRSFELVGLGERQGLGRAAQGGERVLQLVRHVGGEAFDGVDPLVERVGHVAQRAGQMADLVGAVGEVGDLGASLDAVAHALGRRREPLHRPGDGVGEDHRQHDGDGGREQRHAHDAPALRGDDIVDVAAARGQQQHAEHGAHALDRHRDRDHELALVVDPDDRHRRSGQARSRPRDRPCRWRRRSRYRAADRIAACASSPPARTGSARPAPRRRAAAGRSAALRRANRTYRNRGSARRRDYRCGRGFRSASPAAAGSARRARGRW